MDADENVRQVRSGLTRGPPLLVGKFVDVEIKGLAVDEYYKLRRLALRPGNEVWAMRYGRLTIVPVRVLQRDDESVYVTGGLAANLPVIVSGVEIATEGLDVRTAARSDP